MGRVAATAAALGELARTERRPQCSRRPRVTSGHVGDTAVQQGAAEELGHAPTRSVEGSPLRRRQAEFTGRQAAPSRARFHWAGTDILLHG